jgi:hypothetical protein
VVRTHARNLLGVKRFIDAGAWRELQAALRASASNLKQDLYAIIQARPTGQRPELRRLYSDLFNSVTSVSVQLAILSPLQPCRWVMAWTCVLILCSALDCSWITPPETRTSSRCRSTTATSSPPLMRFSPRSCRCSYI